MIIFRKNPMAVPKYSNQSKIVKLIPTKLKPIEPKPKIKKINPIKDTKFLFFILLNSITKLTKTIYYCLPLRKTFHFYGNPL